MADDIAPGGIQADRYEDTRAKFETAWKDGFGPNANTASDTPDGHIIDWGTSMAQAVIEQNSAAYQGGFATTAGSVNELAQLIAPFFGTVPRQATGSTGSVLSFGVVGTVIGQGSVCSTSTGDRFAMDETLTIEQSIWIAYTFGPSVTPTSAQITIGPQAYSASFGVVGTGLEVAQAAQGTLAPDAQISVVYDAYEDANGLGVLIVECTGILSTSVVTTNSDSEFWRGSLMPVTSEVLAAIEAEALAITSVDTPAAGNAWRGVANLASVTVGSDADTQARYLQRHLDTLGKNGSSSLVGLVGRLRDEEKNPGIEYVEIYNNPTGMTDSEGRPLKSFEVVRIGGDAQTMVSIIWENHPLGIQAWGIQTYTVTDPRTNREHTIQMTDATELFAWVDVVIVPGEGFPTVVTSDLEVQVANAIVAFGRTRGMGFDAYLKDISSSWQLEGVKSCTITTGTTGTSVAPKPTLSPSNIDCTDRQILRWDTVRIGVDIDE